MPSFDRSRMIESFIVGEDVVRRINAHVERSKRDGAVTSSGARVAVNRADVLRGLILAGLDAAERELPRAPAAAKGARSAAR
jgi:hypothetical protein